MPNSDFGYKIVDLTHLIDDGIPSWDLACGFKKTTDIDYADCITEVKFKVQSYSMPAGIGTHMDAPAHCVAGGKYISDFSLDSMLAKCFVVDVSGKASADYLVSIQDIYEFEQEFGEILSGSIVVFKTGWEKYWDDPKKYHNNLQFPSLSEEVAVYLAKRKISGIGIDALSPDVGNSAFPVHHILLSNGIFILENMANLGVLPKTGAYILPAVIPIVDGTESPARVMAFIKDK